MYTNQRVYIKFISASQNHIIWLSKRITGLVGIKGSLSCSIPQDKNKAPMWTIKFAKKESVKLIQWIYYKPKLPCLKRKKILAKRALEIISDQTRKKYTRIRIEDSISLP